MACKCCQRYAPQHRDGSPQGPCAGDASIEEARRWALIWKARALEAGWSPLPPKPTTDEEIEAEDREFDRLVALEWEMGVNARSAIGMIADDLDGARATKANRSFALRLRSVLSANEHYDGGAIPDTHEVGRPAFQDAATVVRSPEAVEYVKATQEHLKTCPGAAWCEVCTPDAPLAHCAGPERHPCRVGSPLHEQLLEGGCLVCGAYPEVR